LILFQLEERERAARESELYNRQRTDEEKLEREIERLRKEGAKQLEEEQERMRQQLFEEERQRANSSDQQNRNAGPAKIKVRWSGGNYDREMLKRIFSKFGDVLEVVVLPGKKKGGEGGSGLVEMSTKQAAADAVNIERGFADHPLKIKLLDSGEDKHSKVSNVISSSSSAQKVAESFQDYETLVMRQLRQQEERKRLIEQMLKDEEANE
jgi:DnaJ family protein C protein 17